MNKYLSVEEMISIEKAADKAGLSYSQMMENAGRSLAESILRNYGDLKKKRILALVGKGNNGGDALIALEYLSKVGWEVSAYLLSRDLHGDDLVERLKTANGKLFEYSEDQSMEILKNMIPENSIILDGLLGTGIKLPLRSPITDILSTIKSALTNENRPVIVAVDCPSGVDCENGGFAEETLHADLTVCMAAVKAGMLKFPAFEYLGNLKVVSIGLPEDLAPWKKINRWIADRDFVLSKLPTRQMNSHKGTFGTAMVVAGSLNYTGAALLAGQAAFRSGAGLVSMAVPEPLHTALAGHFPEAIWCLLPHQSGFIASEASERVLNNLDRITAMLIGPGFGLKETSKKFIDSILDPSLPSLVIDADGLKLISEIEDWTKRLPKESILTPHPGEMSILTDLSIEKIQLDRVGIAEKYAQEWDSVIVLKGPITVVASPKGKTVLIPVATPALARAGTGDVLAGLIVGLLAQGMDAFDAAVSGAWLHAEAGKAAEVRLKSAAGVLAGDLIIEIPSLLK